MQKHNQNFAPAGIAGATPGTPTGQRMENRFAGATDLADRRRRRLANEDPFAEPSGHHAVSGLEAISLCGAAPTDVDSQLLRRIISPRLWKHGVLLLAIASAFVAIIVVNQTRARDFGTDLSLVTRSFTGCLLLVSAQLALLIGWLRSRSAVDFQGRYRWWKWFALGLGCVSVLILTDTFAAMPQLASSALEPLTGRIHAARNTLVVVPTVAFWSIVLVRVVPDMSRNFWNQSLLVVAGLTTAVRMMLAFGSLNSTIPSASLDAMVCGASVLTFAAMLLHCRFVAYVSNGPPEGRSLRGTKQNRTDSEATVSSEDAGDKTQSLAGEATGSETPQKTSQRKRSSRKSADRKKKTRKKAA